MRIAWMMFLILLLGCQDNQSDRVVDSPSAQVGDEVRTQASDFFREWLEGHGHTDIVNDANGVGIKTNPTRLAATLFGSKEFPDGEGFIVETDFRIRLPDNQTIQEYVAGAGDTLDEAIADSFANFTLTTFHVIHKAFIDQSDPHIVGTPALIGGRERSVLYGDLYLRGDSDHQFDGMNSQIESVLNHLSLSNSPHWIKIVYSQDEGRAATVSATLDNRENAKMTKSIAELNWPITDSFYMAKQFIVVQ